MLEHMIKAKIGDKIIRSMDMVVGILELGFNNKGRRISSL
jgi:hypothetical protein